MINIDYDDADYYELLLSLNPGLKDPATVHLSTIHGSKGRESDRVILINDMGKKSSNTYHSGDTASEIRVFYVGITRAKRRLDLVLGENGLIQI